MIQELASPGFVPVKLNEWIQIEASITRLWSIPHHLPLQSCCIQCSHVKYPLEMKELKVRTFPDWWDLNHVLCCPESASATKVFSRQIDFNCLYSKWKEWPVHEPKRKLKNKIPVAQKWLSTTLKEGSYLNLWCFIIFLLRKHQKTQCSGQCSLYKPWSDCVPSKRGRYRDTCNILMEGLIFSPEIRCLIYSVYNSKCRPKASYSIY